MDHRLECRHVVLVELELHFLEMAHQALAGEQPVLAGGVVGRQVAQLRCAELVLQGALRLAGDLQGIREALRVEAAELAQQVGVHRAVRLLAVPLVVEEGVDLFGVLISFL